MHRKAKATEFSHPGAGAAGSLAGVTVYEVMARVEMKAFRRRVRWFMSIGRAGGEKAGLRRAALCFAAMAAATLALGATPARAGLDQTWIAAEGTDSGLCIIYLPCQTLAYAIDQTSAGGTINVIDSGFYGKATVTKSLTIRSELGQPSMIASITINAGVNDRVVIEGVDLEGTAVMYNVAYPYGIGVLQANDVLIHNVRIKDYNARGTVGAGVYINSTSQVRVTTNESMVYNNTVGMLVTSANGNAHLKSFRCLILSNLESGVRVVGGGNDAMMSDNSMLGSSKSMDLQNGGAARSFGDNALTSGDVPISMSRY